MNHPKGWNEISVIRYQEIIEISVKEDIDIELLSLLTDISIEELEDEPYDNYVQILEDMSFVNTLPNQNPKPLIQTEVGPLYLIDNLNGITIGEFIDLEYLFTNGYIKNLLPILSILYRQKTFKKSLLEMDEYEPYGNWIYHRAPLFNQISINDVYGIIPKYIKWRGELLENYEGLFDKIGGDDEEEETDPNESVISRSERKKAEAREKSLSKWGYDIFLMKLAGNDITKVEEVTRMNLIFCLNTLSFKKELNID